LPRLVCPHCGGKQDRWDQPRITVDAAVIDSRGRILLIERGLPPSGWALPGGFVDAGETLASAVARELLEETGLVASAMEQFFTYSDPSRDPRHHTLTTVFLAKAEGSPKAGDDAVAARFYEPSKLPKLAFDHDLVLKQIFDFKKTGKRPDSLA
jgi:8-oxo-dGTP diphosphatase